MPRPSRTTSEPAAAPMRIVVLGLSITSSWGNGHATTYRALVRELARRGHDVLFLERDVPWYAENRDLPDPPFGRTRLYGSLEELRETHAQAVAQADLVIVGSFVPDGVSVGRWVQATARGIKAFYDIDTPVTLGRLSRGEHDYLAPDLVPGYDLYLSFTGGPTLERLERELGSPRAVALHCAVDPEAYLPMAVEPSVNLGYMGTYSDDRQPGLQRLLVSPALACPERSFVVAGPMYPEHLQWPANVRRIEHLSPPDHPRFYGSLRWALSITRADMLRAGYSPSVRLFEAAACGTPLVSDAWPGIETFFVPGREILVARSTADAVAVLRAIPERERIAIGRRARDVVLSRHTAAHRAEELERHAAEQRELSSRTRIKPAVAAGAT